MAAGKSAFYTLYFQSLVMLVIQELKVTVVISSVLFVHSKRSCPAAREPFKEVVNLISISKRGSTGYIQYHSYFNMLLLYLPNLHGSLSVVRMQT